MRILYLVDKKIYNTKMSRVRFHNIDAIKRYPGVNLKKTGPGWPGFRNAAQMELEFKPDLVVWYKPLGIPGYNKVKAPKCIQYNELWNVSSSKSEIKTSNSELVICHHLNDIDRYKDKIDNEKFTLVHNPHCAEKAFFHDWGEDKTVDVMIFGTLKPSSCYPLRYKFATKIGRMLKDKGVNYQVFNHPSYRLDGEKAIKHQLKKYAKAINRCKIAVTCASDYHYALAKYSEIPLCRTALCADLPRENQDWYRKWMIYISRDWKADRIIDTIMPYLKDEQKLKEITELGYQENLRLRTQEHYAERFVKIAHDWLAGKIKKWGSHVETI